VKIVNVHEAKTHLSRLLEQVEHGEDIVIARSGTPVARLVRFASDPRPALLGIYQGQGWISDDFNEPLPDEIQATFEGTG
jgi:prevent-host-death family protein